MSLSSAWCPTAPGQRAGRGFGGALPRRRSDSRGGADRPAIGGDREVHGTRRIDSEEFDDIEPGDDSNCRRQNHRDGDAGADARYLPEEAGMQQQRLRKVANGT